MILGPDFLRVWDDEHAKICAYTICAEIRSTQYTEPLPGA